MRPVRRPDSAVAVRFSSKNSPGSRRAGRKPSNTSPKRANRPAPIRPMISPCHGSSQPRSRRRVVEQPREADLVGEVLEPRRLALARRGVLGELGQVVRQRVVAEAELAQQRAVDDEVGVAPDRRGEVAVRRAREPRVAEVARVVARPLRARAARAAGTPRGRGRTARRTRRPAARSRRRARRRPAARSRPAPAASARRGRSASRAAARSTAARAARARGRARGGCVRRGTRRHARSRAASAPRRACAPTARASSLASATRPSVEAERDLGRRHLERAAGEPARPLGRGELAGQGQLLEDLRRRLAPLRLAVGEPRVASGSPSGRRAARRPAASRP